MTEKFLINNNADLRSQVRLTLYLHFYDDVLSHIENPLEIYPFAQRVYNQIRTVCVFDESLNNFQYFADVVSGELAIDRQNIINARKSGWTCVKQGDGNYRLVTPEGNKPMKHLATNEGRAWLSVPDTIRNYREWRFLNL